MNVEGFNPGGAEGIKTEKKEGNVGIILGRLSQVSNPSES